MRMQSGRRAAPRVQNKEGIFEKKKGKQKKDKGKRYEEGRSGSTLHTIGAKKGYIHIYWKLSIIANDVNWGCEQRSKLEKKKKVRRGALATRHFRANLLT
jgi:hypothetical protein